MTTILDTITELFEKYIDTNRRTRSFFTQTIGLKILNFRKAINYCWWKKWKQKCRFDWKFIIRYLVIPRLPQNNHNVPATKITNVNIITMLIVYFACGVQICTLNNANWIAANIYNGLRESICGKFAICYVNHLRTSRGPRIPGPQLNGGNSS